MQKLMREGGNGMQRKHRFLLYQMLALGFADVELSFGPEGGKIRVTVDGRWDKTRHQSRKVHDVAVKHGRRRKARL